MRSSDKGIEALRAERAKGLGPRPFGLPEKAPPLKQHSGRVRQPPDTLPKRPGLAAVARGNRFLAPLAAILMILAIGAARAQGLNQPPTAPPSIGITDSLVALPGQPVQPLSAYLRPLSVIPENFKQPGDIDDTASIQRALNTCNNVQLSSFHTYIVSKAMYACNGGFQAIRGGGDNSIIQLSASFGGATAGVCQDPNGTTWNAVFANLNCGGPTATHGGGSFLDSYLLFENFRVDASQSTLAQTSGIAVFARNAQFVLANHISCNQFADCTAFLGSQDTLVQNSVSTNTHNAGFDNWDSPINSSAVNNTVYCPASGVNAYGYLFNATDTNATHDGVAVSYYSINNKALGCNTASYVDPLTAGGIVQNVNVISFLADALATSRNGILFTGNIQQGQIVAPVIRDFSDVGGYAGIYVGPSPVGGTIKPTGLNITSPQFLNVSVSAGNIAPLRILGAPTTRVVGASYSNVAAPYAVDVDSTGTYFDGTYPVGSSGLANLHGSFPDFHNENYTNVALGTCGTGPSIGGVSVKFSVTVGTGTVTSCAVTFPLGSWAYTPNCIPGAGTAGDQLAIPSGTISTSGLTVTSAASMGGHVFYVNCSQ